MADEGTTSQSLTDKKWNYYGSPRMYYSGLTIGSTAAYVTFTWSGTNTGFGTANNILSQRMTLISSGNSAVQWSFNSGTTMHGQLYGGDAITFDGLNRSGIDLRASSASQFVRLWVW